MNSSDEFSRQGGSQGGVVIIVVAVLVFERVIKIRPCRSGFHGS